MPRGLRLRWPSAFVIADPMPVAHGSTQQPELPSAIVAFLLLTLVRLVLNQWFQPVAAPYFATTVRSTTPRNSGLDSRRAAFTGVATPTLRSFLKTLKRLGSSRLPSAWLACSH